MTEKQCYECGALTENWYGVMLPDGSHGGVCGPCYRTHERELEEWLASASTAEKLAYKARLFGAAGL